MIETVAAVAGMAVLFAALGLVRMRPGCEGDCGECGATCGLGPGETAGAETGAAGRTGRRAQDSEAGHGSHGID